MNITSLIGRLDEDNYGTILGHEVIGTLNLLGQQFVYADVLQQVLTNTYTPVSLLSNPVSRRLLINVMNKEEIITVAHHFGINPAGDVYEAVNNLNFKGGTLVRLLAIFGLNIGEQKVIEFTDTKEISCGYPLYPYQRDIQRKGDLVLSSSQNKVLFHMPTGSGKTRTAISYICQHLNKNEGKNVVWFANTRELLDQACGEFERAWQYLGNRPLKAIKFWDRSTVDLTEIKDSFIVAGLDKAYQALMRSVGGMSIFATNCSLVIMDEAHMAIAPTYALLIDSMMANNAGLIGLSATPGRTWNDPNEDQRLADFFYRQKVMLEIPGYDNPVDYLTEQGYLAKVTNTKLYSNTGPTLTSSDLDHLSKNFVLPVSFLKKISEDRVRNMAIISKVKQLVKSHQRIILFAITKDHAIVLNSIMVALGINSNVVTAETDSWSRAKIISDFKRSRTEFPESMVLCNYGILTTGFDAPETSCAVIARPTDSLVLYSQMVGRAIRGSRSGGNAQAEIVTVIDESLPGFKEVAEAFLNWEDVW